MENFFKIIYAMLIGVVSLSLTGCSDSDEPHDPTMPESGTWTIVEYDELAMRTDSRIIGREDWSFWENEFKKEIAKRKIKINKNTPLEDGWYILSTEDERDNIGYLKDLEKIKIENVEGKSMTAEYYLKQHQSVMVDEEYVLFKAKIKLTR